MIVREGFEGKVKPELSLNTWTRINAEKNKKSIPAREFWGQNYKMWGYTSYTGVAHGRKRKAKVKGLNQL